MPALSRASIRCFANDDCEAGAFDFWDTCLIGL
jgi:hypothetical protein